LLEVLFADWMFPVEGKSGKARNNRRFRNAVVNRTCRNPSPPLIDARLFQTLPVRKSIVRMILQGGHPQTISKECCLRVAQLISDPAGPFGGGAEPSHVRHGQVAPRAIRSLVGIQSRCCRRCPPLRLTSRRCRSLLECRSLPGTTFLRAAMSSPGGQALPLVCPCRARRRVCNGRKHRVGALLSG